MTIECVDNVHGNVHTHVRLSGMLLDDTGGFEILVLSELQSPPIFTRVPPLLEAHSVCPQNGMLGLAPKPN